MSPFTNLNPKLCLWDFIHEDKAYHKQQKPVRTSHRRSIYFTNPLWAMLILCHSHQSVSVGYTAEWHRQSGLHLIHSHNINESDDWKYKIYQVGHVEYSLAKLICALQVLINSQYPMHANNQLDPKLNCYRKICTHHFILCGTWKKQRAWCWCKTVWHSFFCGTHKTKCFEKLECF